LLRLDKLVGEEGRTESQEEGEAFADLGAALSRHVWRVYGEGWGCGLARCCIVFHSSFSVCFIQIELNLCCPVFPVLAVFTVFIRCGVPIRPFYPLTPNSQPPSSPPQVLSVPHSYPIPIDVYTEHETETEDWTLDDQADLDALNHSPYRRRRRRLEVGVWEWVGGGGFSPVFEQVIVI